MAAQHLDMDTFDSVVGNSALPVLVDFWANWCGPCRSLSPIIEELSDDLDGRIVVCKVDVEKNREIALRYKVMSIPTLILFKDGEVIKTMVGSAPKEKILSDIENALQA